MYHHPRLLLPRAVRSLPLRYLGTYLGTPSGHIHGRELDGGAVEALRPLVIWLRSPSGSYRTTGTLAISSDPSAPEPSSKRALLKHSPRSYSRNGPWPTTLLHTYRGKSASVGRPTSSSWPPT